MDELETRLREREMRLREQELELRFAEYKRNKFSSPFVIATIAAIGAVVVQAWVAYYNGKEQRALEDRRHIEALKLQDLRSQHDRLLEIIRTGSVDKAAENLDFAITVGIINERGMQDQVRNYLVNRKPGIGPALPPSNGSDGVDWSTASTHWNSGGVFRIEEKCGKKDCK